MSNESWSCFCHMTNCRTTCGFSFTKDSRGLVTLLTQVASQWRWHSHYKLLLGNTGILTTSCCLATLAFSLQVAAWQHWHSHYKLLLGNTGILATSHCMVTLVFLLQVAARWPWRSWYKLLLSGLVMKGLNIKITNLSVRVPRRPLVAAAQPGHPQPVSQPAGPADTWPQVLPITDSTGRQSQQPVCSAVPLGLPAGEGIIECTPLRGVLLSLVTFVWCWSLLLSRTGVVVDCLYIVLFSALENGCCCWLLVYSAVLCSWEWVLLIACI